MSIVTISRGTFSGGKMLAESLAASLGFRCVDRDVIVEKAAATGVSQDELRDALQKPPSFLDRFGHKKYTYLTLIQAALAEEVKEGKVVYHGNAGHLLLKGGGPVLRVRIIAPLEFRERQKWTHYLYGVNWGDPSLYDIVINLEFIDIAEACDIASGIVRRQRCFEFGAECRRAAEDFALACRVKASLALDRATRHLEFDVTAEDGTVTVQGRLSRPEEAATVRELVLKVQGVTEVCTDELVARPEA